jgi:methionine-S-sulfoxide reductase
MFTCLSGRNRPNTFHWEYLKYYDDNSNTTQIATLANGCFWCSEAIFKRLKGVKSVLPGYSGGIVKNPSYEQVRTGRTGHAEAIQIEFDPKIIPYEKILDIFWYTHDPTTLNRQGNDIGTQYRSAIFSPRPISPKRIPALFHDFFVQDVDQAQARVLAVVQKPANISGLVNVKSGPPAWKQLPTWYEVSEDDHVIPPAVERMFAKQMNATTIALPSSHASLVSHPAEIAQLILNATKGISK